MHALSTQGLYGVMAEFDSAEALIEAARATTDNGYQKLDAYAPYPVEGLSEALKLKPSKVPILTFCGGLIGMVSAYALAYYCSVIAYPLNIGGRPLNSVPSWIPIMFELTILLGGLSTSIGMLIMNGLPMPYHPVFNVERFKAATRDGFFLCVEAEDPKFDREGTKQFLQQLHPRGVYDVEP
jgi:hypothetical protein